MSQYPHIDTLLQETTWAMLPKTLRTICEAVEAGALSPDTRRYFHGADKKQEAEIVAQLAGESVQGTRFATVQGSTGYLYINGPLIPRATLFTDMSGAASLDVLTRDLEALQKNPHVENIVLVLDSPGGSVTGTSEFAAAIKNSKTPVTAYVYGMAASAAYWIASGAQEIVVAPTGLAGGLGTVLTVSKGNDSEGKVTLVSSQTPNKRTDINTDVGKAQLQELVDGLAEVFLETVAMNRRTSVDKVKQQFGAGAMLLPNKALEVGMVDRVDTLANVVAGFSGNHSQKFTAEVEMAPASNKEENNMSDKQQPVEGAAAVASVDAAKVVAEARAEAVKQERDRVADIGSLAKQFDGAHPGVVAAVNACIAEAQADGEATRENTAVKLLAVVAKTQLSVLTAEQARGEAAGAVAGQFAGAVKTSGEKKEETTDAKASKERVERLCAAFDAISGEVK